MNLVSGLTLFVAMFMLAAVPDASVMVVVGRSLASGFSHAVAATLGILLGDVVFILLALSSLSFIEKEFSGAFLVIKLLAAGYLIWTGAAAFKKEAVVEQIPERKAGSLFSSFGIGLLITLCDPKAIVFYMGFLPAFINMSHITVGDALTIVVIAALALGITKLGYAYLARRSRRLLADVNARDVLNKVSGAILFVTGVVVLIRAW